MTTTLTRAGGSLRAGLGRQCRLSAQRTSMAMVKSLLDGLNHQQHMRDGNREPSMTELTVTGAHIQHDLAVIVNAPKIFGVDSPVGSGGNRVRGVFRGT